MASQLPRYPNVKIEYHLVTPLGRCSCIYSHVERAEEELAHPGHDGWKIIKVTTTQYDVTPPTKDEREHLIDHCWSLGDYLRYLNRDEDQPQLCEEYQHWYDMGIHTARELATYLDKEHARNVEKSETYA